MDWKERLKEEYSEVKERYEKLKAYKEQWVNIFIFLNSEQSLKALSCNQTSELSTLKGAFFSYLKEVIHY